MDRVTRDAVDRQLPRYKAKQMPLLFWAAFGIWGAFLAVGIAAGLRGDGWRWSFLLCWGFIWLVMIITSGWAWSYMAHVEDETLPGPGPDLWSSRSSRLHSSLRSPTLTR